MAKTPSGYKNLAAALKKLGVINYDLRHELTVGQKSYITKKYNEYQNYFQNPQEFAVRSISKKTAKAYHESGYKVIKGNKRAKLIMPVPIGAELHIKGKKAIIETHNRKQTFIVSERKDLFMDLSLIENKPLAKNEFLTVRIGETRPINRKFDGSAKMLKYIEAKNSGGKYEGRDAKKWHNDDAVRHIVIVRIESSEERPAARKARERREENEKAKKGKKKNRRN